MKRRCLSILLVLCMVMALLPTTAWAADSDFTIDENGVLTKYNGSGGNVIIPDGVTSIGSSAFSGCSALISVTIPSSVTSIGVSAFFGCTNLTDVVIPNNVNSIGSSAFMNCASLTSVAIPSNLSNIDANTFRGCVSLTNLTIPSSVTNIEYQAFYNCAGLTSVSIPGSVFYIGANAFSHCTALTSATIANGVKYIGSRAFSGCVTLTTVTIPSSVTQIDDYAFDETPWLEKQGEFAIVNGILLKYQGTERCVTIPNGVTRIGEHAFYACSSLNSVDIPNSVTDIGDGAFAACTNLTSVTIPSSVTNIRDYTFSGCTSLAEAIILTNVTSIGKYAFYNCNRLEDVYYAGNEAQWQLISILDHNDPITAAMIHYNSTGPGDIGPVDPDIPKGTDSVYFLSGWDAATRKVQFGDEEITVGTYTVADSVDISNINSLLNKYVLMTMEQGDSSLEYTITDIQLVESRIGTVSATGEHSLTIDGTTYPVREDYVLASYDGEEVLYHTYNGTIMGFDVLKAKTGMLEAWDATTGKATIDGKTYVTNYLSDLSLMSNADNVIGKKIEFSVVDSFDYYPALSFSFCPGFYFSSNAPTNSIERGSTFDLYVGYYFDDGSLDSKSKEFVSVVSDNKIVEIVPDGWSDKYGQHYTAKANSAGNATFTVTNSRNNDAASLNLYVIEKEYGYNFDNVPKLTYEEGKVTNFYNHNGLVVDEFAYTPHKNASGEIDYYVVTMNVYNTLDLYGAVTAYNADGNPTGFYLIDKKEVFQSNLTNTYNELLLEIGDLFYLIGNEKFYSGESISKKTAVTINVPVGGYLEISNSIYSDVALIANITGLLIDGLKSAKGIFDSSFDFDGLISQKTAIIHDVISKDFVGEKINSAIKGVALDDLKNANWNLDNYGECLQTFLNHLSDLGINLMDSISSSIFTLTGFRNISESVLMKIVPTGNLINFLYDIMGIGDQAVTWITFQKSTDFANGIYIYAPSTGKSYSSNGISVIPASSTVESNVVLHSYLVVDETEIPSNTFNDDAETYSITMYKDGKETQPNTTITVRIPLSEKFKGLDKSVIKVYRHNDDGTTTNMNATIVDGYAVFETNHLSYYSIVAEANLPNPVTYTVVFNPNGGTLSGSSTISTNMDGKLSGLPSAYRNDYTFDGWFTSVSGGNKITTDYVFTSDTTVYAHWTKNSGGSSGGGNSSGGGSSSGGSSSGGSSSTSYSITAGNSAHGSVSVSPKSASKGTKVTLTIQPDSGYTLESLVVKDNKGNTVELTKESNAKYTFTMPNSKVTIDAAFIEIERQPSGQISFTDVSSNAYYYDAVAWAVEQGITSGTTATTFSPDAPCTRAQIVTFLWRAAGSPVMGGENPFTDVASGSYYYDAVQWAVAQGITVGTSANTFSPDATCTRGQAVTFLYRYEKSPAVGGNNAFTDVSDNAYYTNAVQWAATEGVTSGTSTTTFSPDATCTRAQIVTFLYRDMA